MIFVSIFDFGLIFDFRLIFDLGLIFDFGWILICFWFAFCSARCFAFRFVSSFVPARNRSSFRAGIPAFAAQFEPENSGSRHVFGRRLSAHQIGARTPTGESARKLIFSREFGVPRAAPVPFLRKARLS